MGRRPYTTSGIAMRTVVRDGSLQTDVNVWNGTVSADSDEMARTLTLGAILVEWPMKEGWQRHEAFVRRISDEVLREWFTECAR
jgi:hypothetical protein